MTEKVSNQTEDFRILVDQHLDALELDLAPRSLYEPIEYALAPGGKRIRPLLVLLSHAVFSDDVEKALPVALASEIFHTFTLLHDDIMDKADSRRGRESVHVKWNDPVAILSGDMMMGLAYRQIHSCDCSNSKQLNLLFDDMVTELCEGQALDGDFETRDDVTLAEYMEMISKKTGALIRFCTTSGAVVAGASTEEQEILSKYGALVGKAFQIQDDLLDLISDDPKWGKPSGGDLLEGKKTYLSLKARELANEKDDIKLMEGFFSGRSVGVDEIPKYRDLFAKLGVLDHARNEALATYEGSIDLLSALPKRVATKSLESIANKLRSRLR